MIVAFESQCVRAAQAATREIPIFFLHVTDPVAERFVTSLAHPGGNLTGFADDAAAQEVLAEVRGAAATLKLELPSLLLRADSIIE